MDEEKAHDRISLDSSDRNVNDAGSKSEDLDPDFNQREKDEEMGTFSPIRSRSQHHSRSRPHSLHPTRSEHSYGGEDGYSCFQEDGPDRPAGTADEEGEESEETREQKRWEVSWDGPNDPMSPRSIGFARKWAIVLIMASSALCVYVVLPLLRFEKEGKPHVVLCFAKKYEEIETQKRANTRGLEHVGHVRVHFIH